MNANTEKVFLKKIYSYREGYVALYNGIRTLKYLLKNKRSKLISRKFIERIMLAVTEVNGCEICAYSHTKMALESGMKKDEIIKLLDGNNTETPQDEIQAILFAQHYADTRGNPTKKSWNRIVEIYKKDKSLIILSTIRLIMIGNIFGIPLSAVIRRIKRKKVYKTNIFYELLMLLSFVVFLPITIIHAAVFNLFRADLTK